MMMIMKHEKGSMNCHKIHLINPSCVNSALEWTSQLESVGICTGFSAKERVVSKVFPQVIKP